VSHTPFKAISEGIWRPEGSHPHFGEVFEVSLSGSVVQVRQHQALALNETALLRCQGRGQFLGIEDIQVLVTPL